MTRRTAARSAMVAATVAVTATLLAACGSAVPAGGGDGDGGGGAQTSGTAFGRALAAVPDDAAVTGVAWEETARMDPSLSPLEGFGIGGLGTGRTSAPFPTDGAEMAMTVHTDGPGTGLVWGVGPAVPAEAELRADGYEPAGDGRTWAMPQTDLGSRLLPWFRTPAADDGPITFGPQLPAPPEPEQTGRTLADRYASLVDCLGDPVVAQIAGAEGAAGADPADIAAGVFSGTGREIVCGPGGPDPEATAARLSEALGRDGLAETYGEQIAEAGTAEVTVTADGLVRIETADGTPPGRALNSLARREWHELYAG
ncbi:MULTISPECIES: hypothetical protein [Pseudonocardia]|nr:MULTISPECIES: hypothetical protein [Pseudonocardia]